VPQETTHLFYHLLWQLSTGFLDFFMKFGEKLRGILIGDCIFSSYASSISKFLSKIKTPAYEIILS
ncbi:hypothetical protein, partial [Streptococcus suis]